MSATESGLEYDRLTALPVKLFVVAGTAGVVSVLAMPSLCVRFTDNVTLYTALFMSACPIPVSTLGMNIESELPV